MAIKRIRLVGNQTEDIHDARIPGVDTTPTSGSSNIITSNAVYNVLSNTYTQSEVNQLIGAINQFKYEIVTSTSAVASPSGNVLYLVGPTGSGSDKYEEYVYANNTWTKIGDTSIDLSGYVQSSDLAAVATTGLYSSLSGKPTTLFGYGITDAKISGNTITLGNNSITPLTGITSSDVTGALGYTPLSGHQAVSSSNNTASFGSSVTVGTVGGVDLKFTMPSNPDTDTKNTAGSTNTDSKIYLIGATSQDANPQTYSDSEVYTTNGTLTTNKVQVGGTSATMQYNSTDQSIEFIFA